MFSDESIRILNIFIAMLWVGFAMAIVTIIGEWKTFKKAGQPGWAALIPIYNIYIETKIVGRQSWWFALVVFANFVPVIGQAVSLGTSIILTNDLSKSFGKDTGFTIGLVLLRPIFMMILGFGSPIYQGPRASGFGLPSAPQQPMDNQPQYSSSEQQFPPQV